MYRTKTICNPHKRPPPTTTHDTRTENSSKIASTRKLWGARSAHQTITPPETEVSSPFAAYQSTIRNSVFATIGRKNQSDKERTKNYSNNCNEENFCWQFLRICSRIDVNLRCSEDTHKIIKYIIVWRLVVSNTVQGEYPHTCRSCVLATLCFVCRTDLIV